ncbi:MAG: N-glycosylase/DNA lyase [Candidatus Gracilibacteria bacterium]|nr:N-glycosylase/DNA lyase [Candidatus Gracilibacteria bacterium]
MNELLEKLKNISTLEAVKIEESDKQYIALKNLYLKIKNKDFYLSLIIANSIICYQLSGSGENYWEEFSNYFSESEIKSVGEVTKKLSIFIKNSKGNKRFIQTKISRLEKLKPFLEIFIGNEYFYYKNMENLQTNLAKIMNQKIGDKTIVFGVKMFSYGSRNYFNKLIYFPENIPIPIDSRLTKIYEKFNDDMSLSIQDFYKNLSLKLNIPPLHLDAVLWVNYEELINS